METAGNAYCSLVAPSIKASESETNFADGLASGALRLGKKRLLSIVGWVQIGAGLSGSAGVLAYFSFACSLFRTTLRLLVQLVGLPLFFIGFGPFL